MSGEFDFMNATSENPVNSSQDQSDFATNAFASGPAFTQQESSYS